MRDKISKLEITKRRINTNDFLHFGNVNVQVFWISANFVQNVSTAVKILSHILYSDIIQEHTKNTWNCVINTHIKNITNNNN